MTHIIRAILEFRYDKIVNLETSVGKIIDLETLRTLKHRYLLGNFLCDLEPLGCFQVN